MADRTRVLALVLALAPSLTALATPARATDADDAMVRSYVLTDDKVQHYIAFAKGVHQAAASDPALRAETKTGDDDQSSPSLAIAAIHKRPALAALIHRAGLTERDVVLIPLVVVSAGVAMQMKPAQRSSIAVSPASLDYVAHHKSQMDALGAALHDTQ